MPVWLDTDEAPQPPRPPRGWAPRPRGKVKLAPGWDVPETGAGTSDAEERWNLLEDPVGAGQSDPVEIQRPRFATPTSMATPSTPPPSVPPFGNVGSALNSGFGQPPVPGATQRPVGQGPAGMQPFQPVRPQPIPGGQGASSAWQPFTPATPQIGSLLTNETNPDITSPGTPSTSRTAGALAKQPVGVLRGRLPAPASASVRVPPQGGRAPTGGTPVDYEDKQSLASYIRYAAAQRGIDPEIAVRVAQSEGMGTYVGDNNSSFGPFQLHYGGVAAGGNRVAGLGDTFTAQTGLDARDPSTVQQQIDFALDQVKTGGWGPWHGAARVGISPMQGVGTFTGDANQFRPDPAVVDSPAVQAEANVAQERAENVADQGGGVIGVGLSALGSKYVWGGAGGRTNFDPAFVGSDCSGFVAWAYKLATGVSLPAQTAAIYKATQPINPRDAQPGDLIQFNVGQGARLEHVGIYLGNGQMLHDSSLNPNGGVQVTPVWQGGVFRRVPGVDPSMMGNYAGGGNEMGAGAEAGPTMDKTTAGYKSASDTRNCRDCTMFRSGACTLVKGTIAPGGTCNHFESKQGAGQEGPLDVLGQGLKDVAQGALSTITGRPFSFDQPPPAQDVAPGEPAQTVPPPVPRVPETMIHNIPGQVLGAALTIPGQVQVPGPGEQRDVPFGLTVPSGGPGQAASAIAGGAMSALGTTVSTALATVGQAPFEEQQKLYPTGGPLAGPIAGLGRANAGFEQLKAENPEYAQLGDEYDSIVNQLPRNATAVILEGGPDAQRITALQDRLEQVRQRRSEIAQSYDMNQLAARNPNINDYENQSQILGALAALPLGLASVGGKAPVAIRAAQAMIDPFSLITHLGGMTPALGYEASRGAMQVVKGLQFFPDLARSATFDAVTRGLARGLDQRVLGTVGHTLSHTIPEHDIVGILRDLAGTGNPGVDVAALTAEAQRRAASIATAGKRVGAWDGGELRGFMLANASPGDVDMILDAHNRLGLTTPYVQAHQAVNTLAARILPEMASSTVGLGIGGIGGLAIAAGWPDDNDPAKQDQRIVAGSIAAMALLTGKPYMVISKTIAPDLARFVRGVRSPRDNLLNDVAPIISHWLGQDGEIGVQRQRLYQLVQDHWGGNRNARDVIIALEKTGQLPMALRTPGGQMAVDMSRQASEDVVNMGGTRGANALLKQPAIDPLDPLHGHAAYPAQFYITRATDKEWAKANRAATIGLTPDRWKIEALDPGQYGLTSRFNTIGHMLEERQYANMEEGEILGKVKYATDDLPRRISDQYAEQKALMNNYNLAGQLEGMIQDIRRLPAGAEPTDFSILRIPKGAWTPPPGYVPAKSLGIGQILNHEDVYINSALKTVLERGFKDAGIERTPVIGPWLKRGLGINTLAKEALLGADIFHSFAMVNQFLGSDPDGVLHAMSRLGEIWQASKTKAGSRAWISRNMPDLERASRAGVGIDLIPEIRKATWGRVIMAGASSFGAYQSGYKGAKQLGASDEDATRAGWVMAAMSLGAQAPLGMLRTRADEREWNTLITMFSDRLFHRTIPAMKLMTWQMHGETEEAARFVNNVYGAENIHHALQSRMLTDITRMFVLAPAWTGGFVNNIGHALFDPGSVGTMARSYWTSAAMNSIVELQLLNYALAGHSSFENEPGQRMTVDAGPMLDKMGINRVHPTTGEKLPAYIDILPHFRALLDPFYESARFGLSALGHTDIGKDTPLNSPQITGSMRPGDPSQVTARTVADAWGRYASGRVGIGPGGLADLLAEDNYMGKPYNRAGDDPLDRASSAVVRQFMRLAPASVQAFGSAYERGVPGPVALATGVAGMRIREPTVYSEAQRKKQGVIREFTGKSAVEQNREYAEHVSNKELAYDQRDRAMAGLNPETGQPDPQLDTPAKRLARMSDIHIPTMPEFEQRMVPQELRDLHPEQYDQYVADLRFLDGIRGERAGQVPADFNAQRAEVDPDALFEEIWNRQPTDLINARDDAERARLRRLWLTKAAEQHDIDHSVLEDFVKARLFGIDLGEYRLPGITSQQLDLIVNEYQQVLKDAPGDPITGRQLQQQTIGKYAKAFYFDADPATLEQRTRALQERVQLRSVAPKEQTAERLEYTRAISVLAAAHDLNLSPQYLDVNGQPHGGPEQWKEFDQALSSVDNWDKQGMFYKDKHLQILAQERARGSANSARIAFTSPGYWEYEHLYGVGRNMTNEQWAKYRAGTLDMWADKPTPQEAQERNKIVALYRTLNVPVDPRVPGRTKAMATSVQMTTFGRTRELNLAAAVKRLNRLRSNAWKAGDLGLDQNITDADAPPGADLGVGPAE